MVVTEYEIGETVYFVNDPIQEEFIITGYTVRPYGIIYLLSHCGSEKPAYDIEFSRDKTVH
ncbi:hypothetical protein [Tenacibaculum sp. 190524A02b]|uniref:hypothetical protein n=1 Tax=Tenacibaculum vairaonense TaxID=3137860 RepID=UPI0031FAD2AE